MTRPGKARGRLDLAAISRDDEALRRIGCRDALSWGDDDDQDQKPPAGPVPGDERDDPALALLLALRLDLDDPTPAYGAGAVVARRRAQLRRGAVAAVVVAAVLSVSGVAAAAIGATPGSPFYPLHRLVVGSEPTPSQRAAGQVDRALTVAAEDLDRGRLPAASAALDRARGWLDRVAAADRGDRPQRLAALAQRYAQAVAAGTPAQPAAPVTPAGPGTVRPHPTASPGSANEQAQEQGRGHSGDAPGQQGSVKGPPDRGGHGPAQQRRPSRVSGSSSASRTPSA